MNWAFMRYIRFFRKSGCIGARLECETHPELLVRCYIAGALSSGRYNSTRDAFPATREFHDPSRG